MTAKSQIAAKTNEKQTVNLGYDLSEIDSLQLCLTDKQGNPVLKVELNREIESNPQLVISTGFDVTGNLKSSLTIYDIDA